MGRNRFVQPDMVRIYLVDVHRRHLADLLDATKQNALEPEKRAKPADIDAAKARLAAAEEDQAWIEIKRELNAGENRRVFGRIVKDMRAGEKVTLDPEQVGLTKLVEYLLGWSFTDANGKPVDVTEGAINSLDQDTYAEITQAIDMHEEAVNGERARKKPSTVGTPKSEATSASPA